MTLRRATSQLRLNTLESDAKLTDYLKTRFSEKHKKFPSGRIEYTLQRVMLSFVGGPG